MIRENILNASRVYLADYERYETSPPPREVSEYESYRYIVQNLPALIKGRSAARPTNYKYQGSVSTGNMAKIPWVCIFDTDITDSATQGYYIVFLFKEDMTGGYLSLNQGFTQFKDKYGDSVGREKAKKSAKFYQKILGAEFEINKDPIDLRATSSLGKGYEAGNICSVYFPFDTSTPAFDDDSFMKALETLKDYYQFLKEDIIDRSMNNDGTEEEFQEEIQEGKEERPAPGGLSPQGKGGGKGSQSWKRKRNRAFTALLDADFKCEVDPSHETFPSPKTGKPFMEAHHLIPMEKQAEFEFSLDVSENIVCLCPTCHRKFHNGTKEDKKVLIHRFHNERTEGLNSRRIYVEREVVERFYKV